MSIIYSAIYILFLASTISATIAPPHIYSAVIHNAQNSPIQCHIVWLKGADDKSQSDLFTIERSEKFFTGEKSIDMGSWQGRAVIDEIHCGDLALKAPFDGVNSPKQNWEFVVHPDEIKSGQSNARVHHY